MELKELCKESHKIAKEKGFYDRDRDIPELLMLCVSELGEACEADRHGDWEMFKEEIADTFIRLADMCEFLEIDIEEEIERKSKINKKRQYRHGKRY